MNCFLDDENGYNKADTVFCHKDKRLYYAILLLSFCIIKDKDLIFELKKAEWTELKTDIQTRNVVEEERSQTNSFTWGKYIEWQEYNEYHVFTCVYISDIHLKVNEPVSISPRVSTRDCSYHTTHGCTMQWDNHARMLHEKWVQYQVM